MGMSLGMSTGAAGVSSALVTTASNGAQNVEFRYLSADQAHTDLGDLVRSSISLMTTQVPADPTTPDAFAVAYRTQEQAHSIRSAVSRQRHRVHLVPETAATLTYLRHTGEVAQHATVAIVDFGESGLSVAVVDDRDRGMLGDLAGVPKIGEGGGGLGHEMHAVPLPADGAADRMRLLRRPVRDSERVGCGGVRRNLGGHQ